MDRRLDPAAGLSAVPEVKTALVTGSAGFVGSAFVDRLLADGWDIELCDVAYAWPRSIDCRRAFAESEKQYDLIIHAAANVGGRVGIDRNPMGISENLALDQAAFAFAVRTKPRHFVYFSSSAAYPVYLQRGMKKSDAAYLNVRSLKESDIDLDLPELPDQMYGQAKIMGEWMARIARNEGVNVHIFRPFSGYGTTQSADYPFAAFIERALRRENPFTIWGDGLAQRDWVHIDDIVNAVMVAVENDLPGPYNLCTGIGTDFNTLARHICQAAGYNVRPATPGMMYPHTVAKDPLFDHKLDAPTGVQHRVGNPELLNTFYTPTVTLQEGIERALHDRLASIAA